MYRTSYRRRSRHCRRICKRDEQARLRARRDIERVDVEGGLRRSTLFVVRQCVHDRFVVDPLDLVFDRTRLRKISTLSGFDIDCDQLKEVASTFLCDDRGPIGGDLRARGIVNDHVNPGVRDSSFDDHRSLT